MTPERRSDESLDREIDAALEGLNLQEIDDATPSGGGRRGEHLHTGTIAGVSGDDVFVDLGPRMQGVISIREFEDAAPRAGERYQFTLHGREDGLWILSRREALALASWNELAVGSHVKARVSGQNKGGLELKIGPHDAFMPASQASLERVDDLSTLLGQTFVCEVLEIDSGRKRVVLSRRSVLEEERRQAIEESVGRLHPGLVLEGKVTRVEPFGAFVDLGGGLEGLVHVSQLSRKRVERPDEHVEPGQVVRVEVLEIKEGGKRIGLSMKTLEPDPWDEAEDRFPVDTVVSGKVTRLADFGAFVELAEGLEGLLHVSQLGRDRVRRPRDVVSVGQELSVRVLGVDRGQQRISLSRLDARGALLGSEEAVEADVIEDALRAAPDRPLGTNLGALFKKALEKKD